MKPLALVLSLLFVMIANFGCKKETLPLQGPTTQTKTTPNYDSEKTISRIVIHSLDFKNFADYDGLTGPDLYIRHSTTGGFTPYHYTYPNVIYNVTPVMLPLTIYHNKITTADFAGTGFGVGLSFDLFDFDQEPYNDDYKQDKLSVSVKSSKEYFSGNEYHVNYSDESTSFRATIYYTYN